MSRDKQIEEMAKDFCAVGIPCEECHLYKNRCHAKKYATRAYNNGYRKASEVAREIFEEIAKASVNWDCYCVTFIKNKIHRLKCRLEEEGGDGIDNY